MKEENDNATSKNSILIRAYANFLSPPENISLNSAVGIEFCNNYCWCHSFDNPDCSLARGFLSSFRKWKKLVDSNVFVAFEYYDKHSWSELIFPAHNIAIENIHFYRDNNFTGILSQLGSNWGSNGLIYYLMAKLAWNPDLNTDALLDDYMISAFGEKAAEDMRNFYAVLANAMESKNYHTLGIAGDSLRLFDSKLIAKAGGYLDNAGKNISTDSDYYYRWNIVKQAYIYTKLYLKLQQKLATTKKRLPQDDFTEIIDFIDNVDDYVIKPGFAKRSIRDNLGYRPSE